MVILQFSNYFWIIDYSQKYVFLIAHFIRHEKSRLSRFGVFPGGDSNVSLSLSTLSRITRTFSRQHALPLIHFHFLYQKSHFIYRVPHSQVFDNLNCRFDPVQVAAPCGANLMDYSPQLVELALLDVLVNIPTIDPHGFSIACGGMDWSASLSDTFPNSKYDDYYRFMATICDYASNFHWLNVS